LTACVGAQSNNNFKLHYRIAVNVDEAFALEWLKEQIKITLVESREKDAWFDIGLRELRLGEVHFYRAKDLHTGEWLFKVCSDVELARFMIKAVKCPPGRLFAQLEGNAMVFQRSTIQGLLYDIISLSRVDEEGRVRREAVKNVEEIPSVIVKNFEVKPYEEATGKQIPGKYFTTLSKENDEKAMVTLFLLERAWPLSPVSPEVRAKTMDLLALIKRLEKTSVDEVRRVANEEFGIGEEEINAFLDFLEREKQIERLEGGYVKTVG